MFKFLKGADKSRVFFGGMFIIYALVNLYFAITVGGAIYYILVALFVINTALEVRAIIEDKKKKEKLALEGSKVIRIVHEGDTTKVYLNGDLIINDRSRELNITEIMKLARIYKNSAIIELH